MPQRYLMFTFLSLSKFRKVEKNIKKKMSNDPTNIQYFLCKYIDMYNSVSICSHGLVFF